MAKVVFPTCAVVYGMYYESGKEIEIKDEDIEKMTAAGGKIIFDEPKIAVPESAVSEDTTGSDGKRGAGSRRFR